MKEFELLASIVEDITSVKKQELISKVRKRKFVELRMMCANIINDMDDNNYTREEIGKQMNVDHATIIYYIKNHKTLMGQKNTQYKKVYNSVLEAFNDKLSTQEVSEKSILLKKKNKLEQQLKEVIAALRNLELNKSEVTS